MKKPVKQPKASVQRSQHNLWLAGLALVIAVLAIWSWSGTRKARPAPDLMNDAVQGLDVSHHQGQIDWQKINPQQYAFVYIKATEGGDFQDPRFAQNWQAAKARGLKVGAYHYFRYCTPAQAQLDNLIRTVPRQAGSLPVVVDVEWQGDCPARSAAEIAEQLQKLHVMLGRLQQYYGRTPMLYSTPRFYAHYLQVEFGRYPLWIQDFKRRPNLKDPRPWRIWQYSQHGRVTGIRGNVDVNVFRGNRQQFEQFTNNPDATK